MNQTSFGLLPLVLILDMDLVLVLLVSQVLLVGEHASLPAESSLVFMSNDSSWFHNLKHWPDQTLISLFVCLKFLWSTTTVIEWLIEQHLVVDGVDRLDSCILKDKHVMIKLLIHQMSTSLRPPLNTHWTVIQLLFDPPLLQVLQQRLCQAPDGGGRDGGGGQHPGLSTVQRSGGETDGGTRGRGRGLTAALRKEMQNHVTTWVTLYNIVY